MESTANVDEQSTNDVIEELKDKALEKTGGAGGILGLLKSKHPIGNMNGHWATLFKFVLITGFFMTPTLFAWMVWSTTENFANQYNRQQTQDISIAVEALHEDLTLFQASVSDGMSNIGINEQRLADLEKRLQKLEEENYRIQSKINGLDDKNSAEHTKIMVLLESIKTKMDIIHDKPKD